MGTRGFTGFVIDGRELIAYSHADSYPEHLGVNVLRWLRDGALNFPGVMEERARKLRADGTGTSPSPADVERLLRYAGAPDGTRPPADWYTLLRRTQGDPALMLEAGVIEDAGGFPYHPAARWGYLIDLDAKVFEVYQGGQTRRHDCGRFARPRPSRIGGREFWPAALTASWPFRALPREPEFTGACYGGGRGERGNDDVRGTAA